MAEANEDIDVIIPDDAPPAADVNGEVVKVEAAETPEPKVVAPEDGLEELKTKLEAERLGREEERTARLAAEANARQHSEQAVRAQTETQDRNVALVTNAIESAKLSGDVLEANYADALANQDYAAAAKVQREMSANASRLFALEDGLQRLKAMPAPVAPAPQQIVDPVEALASQLTPQSAAWVRAHPQFATDQRLNRRMLAAHNLAITDGLEADSPQYFAAVEKTLGVGQADANGHDALSVASEPTQRRQAPPAAPVTRNGTGNGSRPNTVRLTPAEREMAEMMDMSPEDYARQKLRIEREKEGMVH